MSSGLFFFLLSSRAHIASQFRACLCVCKTGIEPCYTDISRTMTEVQVSVLQEQLCDLNRAKISVFFFFVI